MESLLRDLRTLLGQQVENLRTLEEVIQRQRACLVKRDMDGVIDSISEQDRCLERVCKMEEVRARLMAEISDVLGLGPGGITLRELTENLDPGVAQELRSTGEAIRETLEKIGLVNRDNRRLIEHSLEFVQEMLATLSGGGSAVRTYEASGSLRRRPQEHVLVDRMT